jgi:hypothetical protein
MQMSKTERPIDLKEDMINDRMTQVETRKKNSEIVRACATGEE